MGVLIWGARGCARAGGRRRSIPTGHRTGLWLSTRKLRRRHQVRASERDSSHPPPTQTLSKNKIHARSISVLQWLLNAETSHPTSSPPHRLTRFFTTLHTALRNPSRAVLQFYPTSDDQVQLITSIAQRAGFGGGVVVDYPNSKKARKVFLCLFVGEGAQVPGGLQEGDEAVASPESEDARAKFERRRQRESRRERSGKQKAVKGGRDWILRKKDVRGAHSNPSHLPPPH